MIRYSNHKNLDHERFYTRFQHDKCFTVSEQKKVIEIFCAQAFACVCVKFMQIGQVNKVSA